MREVADFLLAKADSFGSVRESDVFARSAFNRYYYSAFLSVREVLRQIDDAKYNRIAHAQVPEILIKLRTKLVKLNRSARKSGILNRDELRLAEQGPDAARALAALIQSAYGIRSIADYEPENLVAKKGGEFLLQDVSCLEAKRWEPKAKGFAESVLAAWRIHGA